MTKKMLIDAAHPEEIRVAVLDQNRVEDFDFESAARKPLRGNIYLARVTRVEPSLQAAFVEYGGNRHGFLAFSEIHPDYYQIPVADRERLQAAEAEVADLAAQLELSQRGDEDDEDPGAEDARGLDDIDGLNGARRPAGDAAEDDADDDGDAAEDDEAEEEEAEEEEEEEDVKHEGERDRDAPADNGKAASAKILDAGDEAKARDGSSESGASGNAAEDADAPAAEDNAQALPAAAQAPHPEAAADRGASDDEDEDADADADGDPERDETHQEAHEEDGAVADAGQTRKERNALFERYKEAKRKRSQLLRNYKIQEVIKRRQILLIQVVKEERGNKGAALTTYLSLAGRYCVLMPNTARGGGISRKIPNGSDRRRLRRVVDSLEVPQGMGLIIRTAGAKRTKTEIKRDYEYLLRLWENIRSLTLKSIAPCLIYEEASLIKRAIRDLYDKDISKVLVEGEAGYREAKDFMKMLMPSHAKHVQPHKDRAPVFLKYGVEAQLDGMYQPSVRLKSGGYIVIHQTEALVAIDVNSGRATRERNIELTALKTNVEAAHEAARQCRLRDLAGLIVIDFIDMEEQKNNRKVEKALKDALKADRARIQTGRISAFGLLEMSRQRRRSGIVDGTTQACPTCGGAGVIRSQEMAALRILRAIEGEAISGKVGRIAVRGSVDVSLYLLNHHRDWLKRIETDNGVAIEIIADTDKAGDAYDLEKSGAPRPVTSEAQVVRADQTETIEVDEEVEVDAAEDVQSEERDEEKESGRKRRRRRRRKKEPGAHEETASADAEETADNADKAETSEQQADAAAEGEDDKPKRRRRRGRRGGRRNRQSAETAGNDDDAETANAADAASSSGAGAESSDEAPEVAPHGARDAAANADPSPESGPPESGPADTTSQDAQETANADDDAQKFATGDADEEVRETPAAEPAHLNGGAHDSGWHESGEAAQPQDDAPLAEASKLEEAEPQASDADANVAEADAPEAAEPETTGSGSGEPEDNKPKKPARKGWWQRASEA